MQFKDWQNQASSNSFFSRVREDTNIPLIASYSANINFSTLPFFTALWIVIFQGNFDTTVTSVLLAAGNLITRISPR